MDGREHMKRSVTHLLMGSALACVLYLIPFIGLAFWMASRTLFPGNRIDALAVVLAIAAFCSLRLLRWPTGWVVLGCAGVGWISQWIR